MISFVVESDQLEAQALPLLLNLISSRLELISHQRSKAWRTNSRNGGSISAQQRGLVKFVWRRIMNLHAEWNHGLTFEIGPGEVCDTGVELLP
jgi:hypothetical protein